MPHSLCRTPEYYHISVIVCKSDGYKIDFQRAARGEALDLHEVE